MSFCLLGTDEMSEKVFKAGFGSISLVIGLVYTNFDK